MSTLLTREKCVACRADSPHVTDEEVAVLHPKVSDWNLIVENGVKKLDRLFKWD